MLTHLIMLTLLILCVLALIAARNAGAHGRHGHWQWHPERWMPRHWQNLAACESGSNPPNWEHDGGTYEGAFGFYYGSWDQFKLAGYPSSAANATPWQQWQVARRIAARYGIAEPWGCWRGSEHAWVRAGLPEYGTYR